MIATNVVGMFQETPVFVHNVEIPIRLTAIDRRIWRNNVRGSVSGTNTRIRPTQPTELGTDDEEAGAAGLPAGGPEY